MDDDDATDDDATECGIGDSVSDISSTICFGDMGGVGDGTINTLSSSPSSSLWRRCFCFLFLDMDEDVDEETVDREVVDSIGRFLEVSGETRITSPSLSSSESTIDDVGGD